MTLNPDVIATFKFLLELIGLSMVVTTASVTPFKPLAQKASAAAYPLIVQGISVAFGIASMIGLFVLLASGTIGPRAIALAGVVGVAVGFAASGHYDFLTALRGLAASGLTASAVDLAPTSETIEGAPPPDTHTPDSAPTVSKGTVFAGGQTPDQAPVPGSDSAPAPTPPAAS